MKIQKCDKCEFKYQTNKLICRKKHKPRFYLLKYPYDANFGYKCKCDDFKEKE